MNNLENFFKEVYIEVVVFDCFYGELEKLTEQTEKEIINTLKDNLNIENNARKITRAGMVLAEFENKGTDFIIKAMSVNSVAIQTIKVGLIIILFRPTILSF